MRPPEDGLVLAPSRLACDEARMAGTAIDCIDASAESARSAVEERLESISRMACMACRGQPFSSIGRTDARRSNRAAQALQRRCARRSAESLRETPPYVKHSATATPL